MISFPDKTQFVNRLSVLAGDITSAVRKMLLMVANAVKKPFRKNQKTRPRLDLFSDTIHNNSLISYCKEEEKKRLINSRRLIEL